MPSSAVPCAVVTPTASATPPSRIRPEDPTLPAGDFGGDATVSGYATVLAKCRASSEAQDVVESAVSESSEGSGENGRRRGEGSEA